VMIDPRRRSRHFSVIRRGVEVQHA
jgi:hypothetical protein